VNANNNTSAPSIAAQALERRLALRMAASLNEATLHVGPDIGERLRVAREQAVARARVVRAAQAGAPKVGITAAGALLLGGGHSRWWVALGGALPLLALVAGLLLIQKGYGDEQIAAAAEIDSALLADDVPPKAYVDAGFVEFLKKPRD
jgi:hypothetical protein